MIKRILPYSLIILGLLSTDGSGWDAFFFPNHLKRKVSNQIKKSFDLDQFAVIPFQVEELTIDADIMEIIDADSNKVGYGIVRLANGCKIGGCVKPDNIDPETEHEQFYFSTLYDVNGEIVSIKVLEYTSQYGYEITAKSWLKQFIGKKGGSLKVDHEIDGISGATISVHSIVNEVNSQQNVIEK